MPDWCLMLDASTGSKIDSNAGFPKILHFSVMLEAQDWAFLSNAGGPRSYISKQCWRPKILHFWAMLEAQGLNISKQCWRPKILHSPSVSSQCWRPEIFAFRQLTLQEHWASQHCWWWRHLPRSVLGLRESLHGQAMGAVEDGVLDKDLKRGTKMSYIDTRSEAKRYSGFNDKIGFRRFALFWINWTLF